MEKGVRRNINGRERWESWYMWKVTHLSYSITQDTQQFFHHSYRHKGTLYHLSFILFLFVFPIRLGHSSPCMFLRMSSIELVLVLRGWRGQWQGELDVGLVLMKQFWLCCKGMWARWGWGWMFAVKGLGGPGTELFEATKVHERGWMRCGFSSAWIPLSWNLFCKCETAAAAKQDVNHSQTGTCANYYANLSPRRNGAPLKMAFKLSLQSNLRHQSAVNSPCVEQISRHVLARDRSPYLDSYTRVGSSFSGTPRR